MVFDLTAKLSLWCIIYVNHLRIYC